MVCTIVFCVCVFMCLSQGIQGATGIMGPQGERGPIGFPGFPGPKGQHGPIGTEVQHVTVWENDHLFHWPTLFLCIDLSVYSLNKNKAERRKVICTGGLKVQQYKFIDKKKEALWWCKTEISYFLFLQGTNGEIGPPGTQGSQGLKVSDNLLMPLKLK